MESCDFLDLLREEDIYPKARLLLLLSTLLKTRKGTTILAVRYNEGVLVAGDRRATMGNLVVYDRADKVLSIDDDSVMAISGLPGYRLRDCAHAGDVGAILSSQPAAKA